MAIDCYNVTTPVVSVMNGGWSGSTALQWSDASHGYSITNAILALAPDLCIYEIGTNEENGSSTVAQEAAYYQAVVTACKASGDIILMMHHDNNLTSSYQATTLAAMQSVAASNNVPLINMYARMGPYSQLNALGEIYSSTVHLSATGYADKASFIANLLLSL
jgi:lysophospholipase L1-like esterase